MKKILFLVAVVFLTHNAMADTFPIFGATSIVKSGGGFSAGLDTGVVNDNYLIDTAIVSGEYNYVIADAMLRKELSKKVGLDSGMAWGFNSESKSIGAIIGLDLKVTPHVFAMIYFYPYNYYTNTNNPDLHKYTAARLTVTYKL